LSSIGEACAKELAIYGVNLALTYSSNKAGTDALVDQLKRNYGYATSKDGAKTDSLLVTTYQVDLASIESAQNLIAEIKKDYGTTPAILISNAGYGKRIGDVWDIPVEEFDYMLNVNLRASFLLVKGVIEEMRDKKWGRIVFISSIAAFGAGINGCRKSSPLIHRHSISSFQPHSQPFEK